MSTNKRGWLIVAAALAVGSSGIARADDSGGGDAGDNGMNPMYGDSYATLQGQGHNIGTPQMATEGAFAAHEMDGRTTPLMDQMRQAPQRMAEQTRHNWNTMMERTHAMTDRMRTAFNTSGSTTAEAASDTNAAPAASVSTAPRAKPDLTGSTTAPSAAGQVVASPPPATREPMVVPPAQSTNPSGYRIAPVNPKGQAPTVTGPTG